MTPLAKYQGGQAIAGSYGKSMFSFCKKLPNCLPVWLYHLAFPPAMKESSCCSTSSPTFGVVSVTDFGHSDKSTVVSHFNFHFPDDIGRGESSCPYLLTVYLLL